mgnify:CR=1 FL=1
MSVVNSTFTESEASANKWGPCIDGYKSQYKFVREEPTTLSSTSKPGLKCFADFKTDGSKFYYALGSIKAVGYEAISNIIKEREKNGKFNSLNDFLKRVNPKDINKLQLEGLTKAGAFDEFDKDRNKIFNSIPKIIQKIKNVNDDKLNNQSSLFESKYGELDEFDYLSTTPWKQKELLYEEFKSLGFYVSDHPLSEYKEVFDQLNIISLIFLIGYS